MTEPRAASRIMIWTRVAGLLNETAMGFFALTAALTALAPLVLGLGTEQQRVLDLLDWPIVAIFALELICKYCLSTDRTAFFRDPWRWLDILIVLAPLVSLLPAVSDQLRSAPALRLIRLARAMLLGARSGEVLKRSSRGEPSPPEDEGFQITGIVADHLDQVAAMGWSEFVERLSDPAEEWFHLGGLDRSEFPEVAAQLRVPELMLASKLLDASYPRIDLFEGQTILFLGYPAMRSHTGSPSHDTKRAGLLVVGSSQNLVSMSSERLDLGLHVAPLIREAPVQAPFLVRVMHALMKHVVSRYDRTLEVLDEDFHSFEVQSPEHTKPEFFQGAFRLRRELTALKGDLDNVRKILQAIPAGKIALSGFSNAHQTMFTLLADEVGEFHQRAEALATDTGSLIELHMNVASFEMNKVMRLLALVTMLALFPSVVGGLLGMNVEGNPWPTSLSTIAYLVGSGMFLSVYVFWAKGWFK